MSKKHISHLRVVSSAVLLGLRHMKYFIHIRLFDNRIDLIQYKPVDGEINQADNGQNNSHYMFFLCFFLNFSDYLALIRLDEKPAE